MQIIELNLEKMKTTLSNNLWSWLKEAQRIGYDEGWLAMIKDWKFTAKEN